MNTIVLVFAAALAVAQAGVLAPLAKTTVLQGPSTSAHVVGNDGHGIVAHAPGASITATEDVGGAAVAYSAPVVAHASPVVAAYSAPVVAHAAYSHADYAHAAYSHAVPAVHAAYAAPAYAHHGAVVARTLVASPVNADGYPVLAAGSGIEGQYVHDYNEALYDDGSYKGEIY